MTHLLDGEDVLDGETGDDVKENIVWQVRKLHPAAGTMERYGKASMFTLEVGRTSQAKLLAATGNPKILVVK